MCTSADGPEPNKEAACTELLSLPQHLLARIVELVGIQDKLSLFRCCTSLQDPVLRQLKQLCIKLTPGFRASAALYRATKKAAHPFSIFMLPGPEGLQAQAVIALLQMLEPCPAVTELVLQVRGAACLWGFCLQAYTVYTGI